MATPSVAIIGAAETTQLGKVPGVSHFQHYADAALQAMEDAGLKAADIDGIACVEENPADLAYYLGIKPTWVDGTSVGGCAPLMHIRHGMAAIAAGHCSTVLVAHGESGKSRVGGPNRDYPASSLSGQFDIPFGFIGAATHFTLPVLRYMHEFNVPIEQIANVAVVQREWARRNPRAYLRDALTVEDVLDSRMIAYPFTRPMCCLVTDGGGAIILTSAERARDFSKSPVYILGTGEATETYCLGIAQLPNPIQPQSTEISGRMAFKEAGLTHTDIDHLMIYDAFAHLPLWGLEGLGFVPHGEAGRFVWDGHTRENGSLPMNTNGGGLSYTHTGHYGIYAVLESIRQLRGEAAAQLPDINVSMTHAFGNIFSACATLILSNQAP